jgi:sialic acid synthase SpsE/quercetin dioxygenase-like cupin family protein
MEKTFNYDDLFVLDLANNHSGDIDLGLRIVNSMGEVVRKHGVRTAFKFQFRQLDSFIHKDHQTNFEHKQIKRFQSTRLHNKDFQLLFDEVKKNGMLTMCTPFDEDSVDIIEEMEFDIIKVASCSAKDWPLLEKISTTNIPCIISTGGLDIEDIDNIVSFCYHRGMEFALMHCISIYPTPAEACYLNQIDLLKKRYPKLTIGWSTHEDPNDCDPILVSYAKGARMFERHVGVETDTVKLNSYSSNPAHVDKWIKAYKKAQALCGNVSGKILLKQETEEIHLLQRGIYVNKDLKAGETITKDDVYFAIPFTKGQLPSGKYKPGIVLNTDLKAHEGVFEDKVTLPEVSDSHIIQTSLHEVKAMLNEACIPINSNFKVEYSHHYGVKNFRETGAVLIDLINREYCKKIIVMLPQQKHPSHFHRLKEETFYVLYGTVQVEADGHKYTLNPGEQILIQPGVWHSFSSETGCIFEEISTTHYNDDSFYKDKKINKMPRSERKTVVDHWGRFQLVVKEERKAKNLLNGQASENTAKVDPDLV